MDVLVDPSMTAAEVADTPFSDEELTRLALAADLSVPLSPTAKPWNGPFDEGAGALPAWYMPRPSAVTHRLGARLVIAVVIAGLFIIPAFGLCITSGFISLA
jgi:hypothetical protein